MFLYRPALPGLSEFLPNFFLHFPTAHTFSLSLLTASQGFLQPLFLEVTGLSTLIPGPFSAFLGSSLVRLPQSLTVTSHSPNLLPSASLELS